MTEIDPAAGAPATGTPSPPSFFADFLELVYGVFFSPVATLRAAVRRPVAPFGASLLGFELAVLINCLAGLATARTVIREFLAAMAQAAGTQVVTDFGSFPAGFVAVVVVAALLLNPITLFFKAGALGLMSSFLGGRGDASRLYAAFGLTYLPSVVAVPVSLLTSARSDLGSLGLALTLGILVWRLVLDIIAIREVYDFGTGKAVAAALLPLGVPILLFIVLVIIWLMTAAALIGPMLNSGVPGVG